MTKLEIYELRTILETIWADYHNDVGKYSDGSPICRATRIDSSIKKGINICNKSINSMQPLKYKIKS
jgi:hypothetical protein